MLPNLFLYDRMLSTVQLYSLLFSFEPEPVKFAPHLFEVVNLVFDQVLREVHTVIQSFQKWEINVCIEVSEQIVTLVGVILLDSQ